MTIRRRNILYTLVLFYVLLVWVLAAHAGPKGHHVDVEATIPAPIFTGGAMPVQWTNIASPTTWDWFGLFPPEAHDGDYPIEWAYVSCTQIGGLIARATGICGLVIPSTVPPGTYEVRLYSGLGDGYTRLSTSHKFEVLDGGVR